jgi:hypothetical protein
MISKTKNIFQRKDLSTINEIFLWWMEGTGLLNIFYILYTVIYLVIIVTLFNNGWIFFLFPGILSVWIIINSLFFSGFFLEMALSRAFRFKLNFDKLGIVTKEIFIMISAMITAALSLYYIYHS